MQLNQQSVEQPRYCDVKLCGKKNKLCKYSYDKIYPVNFSNISPWDFNVFNPSF